jgi:hypothetical protein
MFISSDSLQIVNSEDVFPSGIYGHNSNNLEFIKSQGYYVVSAYKSYDKSTQKLVSAAPHIEDGMCYVVEVVDLTEEDLTQRAETQWQVIRNQRNQLLKDSDWTQLADAPVDKSVWATYRQSLRDITQQSDPFNIVWPTV